MINYVRVLREFIPIKKEFLQIKLSELLQLEAE
jgi:hypothetical protein